jgi:hypothetical protein
MKGELEGYFRTLGAIGDRIQASDGADNKLRRLGDRNFHVPDNRYGFVEISHLAICHAVLDLSMGMTSLETAKR